MIRILLAFIVALLVGGALNFLWRDKRHLFWPALAGTLVAVAAVIAYIVWMPAHGRGNLPADAIRVEALALETAAGSYRVRARIHNDSPDLALSRLPLRLVIEDCPTAATADKPCRVVGDRTQEILASVPAGGHRDIVQVYPLPPADIRGALRWHLEAGAADAHPSPSP